MMSETKISPVKFETLLSPEELWLVNILFRNKAFEAEMFSEEVSYYLCDFARRNGLAAVLYRSSYIDCLTVQYKLELKKEYLYNLGRNTAFQLIADEIVNILHEYDIPVILLKGGFLASYVYPDVAFRPMGDIDILVPMGREHEAWKILNPGVEPPNFDEESGPHLLPFFFRGCQIEVHRYLFAENVKYTIPVKDIWKEALPIEGKKAFTVHPVQQVVYLAIHIYYSYRRGGIRLGWMYDFKALTDYYRENITLEKVEQQARLWNVWEPVKQILSLLAVLQPDSSLAPGIPKLMRTTLEEMIRMLQTSNQQNPKYSYGVVWERFIHTKGFKKKLNFLWNVITTEKYNKKQLSFSRIWHLTKNTCRYFIKRIFA